MKLYGEISKIEERDDGTLFVSGIASTEDKDIQGEVVTAAAMKAAMPDFFKFGTGNLREMHQAAAAGTVEKAYVEDGKTYIECVVVDPVAIKKVQTGTYKGFSIGGKSTQKADGLISGLRLTEISLVDRPANPECVINLWKGDDMPPEKLTPEAAVEQLAALLTKGDIDPVKLLAMAKGEGEKVVAAVEGAAEKAAVVVEAAAKAVAKEVVAVVDAAVAAVEGEVQTLVAPKKEGTDTTTKMVATGDVEKGMYSVQEFASALQSLSYIASSAEYEAASEKDNSPVPAQLRDWLAAGATIFKDMAIEESTELVASLQAAAAPLMPSPIAMADTTGDIAKGGAKFSADTKAALNEVHGHVKACHDAIGKADKAMTGLNLAGEPAPAAKADTGSDIAKLDDGAAAALVESISALAIEKVAKAAGVPEGETLAGYIAKMAGDRDAAQSESAKTKKAADAVAAQLDTLQKRFDKMPVQPKGFLHAIARTEDVSADVQKSDGDAADLTIAKADGTPDYEAMAVASMKKVHASGGLRVTR